MAALHPERGRRDPQPVRFVAGAARHEDADRPDGAAQRQRPCARRVSRVASEGHPGVLPGPAGPPAARARDTADARLRRHALVRRRPVRGGARRLQPRRADGARRKPRRRRNAHLSSGLHDARVGPPRAAPGHRPHRQHGPHLGGNRGSAGSHRRHQAGARVIDFVLHFDKHLIEFVHAYGAWVYGILFAIVFAETGLVVTPFLPGDSLLFAAGALAATVNGGLNPWILFVLLAAAAFTGNAVNYTVGRQIGPRVFVATDTTSTF